MDSNTEAIIGAYRFPLLIEGHISAMVARMKASLLNQALPKRLYDLTPAAFPN